MRAEDFTLLEPLPPEGDEPEPEAPPSPPDRRRLKGAVAGVAIGALIGTGMVAVATRRSRPTAVPAAQPPTTQAVAGPAYLGVAARNVTGNGAQVVRVVAGSPAAIASVQPGDVIGAMDGTPIASASGLTTAIRAHRAGDRVRLRISSQTANRTVTVTLAALPPG
jgi:S1-C subfamily serine protease